MQMLNKEKNKHARKNNIKNVLKSSDRIFIIVTDVITSSIIEY